MKVYIVTDGSYSDYGIERVFSNRAAAEEYKKWRNIYNDIEEWEIYDEPFSKEDGEKTMLISVCGRAYSEAIVNLRYKINPYMIHKGQSTRGVKISQRSWHNDDSFDINIYRYVPADKWDEEKYKDKLTKALYDYAAVAKDMLAEGANVEMVNRAFMDKENEYAESSM